MCDTLGTLNGAAGFLKNSDRSPNEPQVLEWHAARVCEEKQVKTTYITVEQAKQTHALLLSRPVWLWGGEMGVNDCGVCIGNEAVFTKGRYNKTGLTGMDLLRLALERSATAGEALDTIIALLERYGQGGNCGYDHNFYYDNSFLIMDRDAIYILETAAKQWVYKKVQSGSISNRLSVATEGDRYSGGVTYDFMKRHSDPVYTYFSGSAVRKSQSECSLRTIGSTQSKMQALRTHAGAVSAPLCENSVRSVCMHAGGLIGDHTTASMIVELDRDTPLIWATGSSTPCISLFKPYAFGNPPSGPVFAAGDAEAQRYWEEREDFHRSLLGRALPSDYYAERDELEKSWIEATGGLAAGDIHAISHEAARQEKAFYEKWQRKIPEKTSGKAGFHRYWKAKNARRMQP